jgi:RING-type zinc-finger/PHD-finger
MQVRTEQKEDGLVIYTDLAQGCPICMETTFEDPVRVSCGHVFDMSCIKNWIFRCVTQTERETITCPFCRALIQSTGLKWPSREEVPLETLHFQAEGVNDTLEDYQDGTICEICEGWWWASQIIMCDAPNCKRGYHTFCLWPHLEGVPEEDWICPQHQ